ncbi:aminoglycoside 6-adenylyltransferase [Rossellomorea vietnamensis]|uniref:aminoglycoside 6-adenylyltransferase n=1 Tax=Rossellomorea vietnamensis TaxID=218284 RepID=UPI003D2B9B81
MWDSLFTAGELFRTLAKDIADHRCFSYPSNEDVSMTAYLNQERYLPSDAIEIFA